MLFKKLFNRGKVENRTTTAKLPEELMDRAVLGRLRPGESAATSCHAIMVDPERNVFLKPDEPYTPIDASARALVFRDQEGNFHLQTSCVFDGPTLDWWIWIGPDSLPVQSIKPR